MGLSLETILGQKADSNLHTIGKHWTECGYRKKAVTETGATFKEPATNHGFNNPQQDAFQQLKNHIFTPISEETRARTRLLNCPVAGASPNITQSDIHHMISMRTIVTRGFEGLEEPGIAIADVHESLIGDKKL